MVSVSMRLSASVVELEWECQVCGEKVKTPPGEKVIFCPSCGSPAWELELVFVIGLE